MQDQSGSAQKRAPYQYGTPEYYRWLAAALRAKKYTWEQAERDQADYLARSRRAHAAQANGARRDDPRAGRKPPAASRQYAKAISTRAMRDDRLTPGAKACLVVIVAEIGDRPARMLCNSYLAQRLSRCSRTIQRYVAQLTRLGYIKAVQVLSERRMTVGRSISVNSEIVHPWWHHATRNEQTKNPVSLEFQGMTKMSPTNDPTGQLRTITQSERTSCAIPHLSYPQKPQQPRLWPT